MGLVGVDSLASRTRLADDLRALSMVSISPSVFGSRTALSEPSNRTGFTWTRKLTP
jgi:hypothetical protein